MNTIRLKLYITGQTVRSEQAVANLRRLCTERLQAPYEMVVIDVLEQPQEAEHDKILATPTLLRQTPPPTRRVIGDLSDLDRVLDGLGLRAYAK